MTAKLKEKPLVFVVEDNHAYRLLIGRILQKSGYMVMMFEHGRKAVEMLGYIKPNLILSDIAMPCMDGFEFLRFIRQHFSNFNIPFVYLTSSITSQNMSTANELGAQAFLGKPVSPGQLTETLSKALKTLAA